MAGVRLDRSTLPETVGEGVNLHHRTDRVFHSLPAFTTGVRQLGEQSRACGLPVGASRAIGHAGWELLLDGCLLGRSGAEERFVGILEGAPDVAEAVSPADPDRWRGLLATMRVDRWWVGYRDTETVAYALHRRLRARRRLSFSLEEVPQVADALALARPAVEMAADDVVGAVIAAMR